jgi:hypothetical protein
MSDQIKFEEDTEKLEPGYYVTSYMHLDSNNRVYLHGPFARPDQAADALRYDLIDTLSGVYTHLSEKEKDQDRKNHQELFNITPGDERAPFVWVGFWRDAMFAIELVDESGKENQ